MMGLRGETIRAAVLLILGVLLAVPVSASQETGPRGVLLVDSFDDEGQGTLTRFEDHDLPVYAGYEDGEYRVQVLEAGYTAHSLGWVDGQFADVAMGIDVRLVGDTTFSYVSLGCRATQEETRTSEYRLSVYPRIRSFALGKVQDGDFTFLSDWEESPLIRGGGATNRLDLICIGDEIIVGINGEQAVAVQDDAFGSGSVWFGVASAEGSATADARFDNLVVNALLAD